MLRSIRPASHQIFLTGNFDWGWWWCKWWWWFKKWVLVLLVLIVLSFCCDQTGRFVTVQDSQESFWKFKGKSSSSSLLALRCRSKKEGLFYDENVMKWWNASLEETNLLAGGHFGNCAERAIGPGGKVLFIRRLLSHALISWLLFVWPTSLVLCQELVMQIRNFELFRSLQFSSRNLCWHTKGWAVMSGFGWTMNIHMRLLTIYDIPVYTSLYHSYQSIPLNSYTRDHGTNSFCSCFVQISVRWNELCS